MQEREDIAIVPKDLVALNHAHVQLMKAKEESETKRSRRDAAIATQQATKDENMEHM